MLIFSSISFVKALEYELRYDENGNLIKDIDKNYEYNSQNELVNIKDINNKTIASYFYDDQGNRVKKINYLNNETTYYINENFIRIVNSSGTYDIEYYYANGQLIGRLENGKKYFYHPDSLGSTNIITNEQGNVVEKIEYKPFGETLEGGKDRFGFTGQEKDKESSLMYYGARYYSPFMGKFIQPDTAIQNVYDPQSLNRYSYARNNPLKYVDESGHFINLIAGAIGYVAGYIIGGVVSAVSQYINTGSVDVWQTLQTAGVGGVAGGVAGLTFGLGTAVAGSGYGGYALGGAIAGVAGGRSAKVTSNVISGNKWSSGLLNPKEIALEAGIGAVAGVAGRFISSAVAGARGGAEKISINKLYGHATDYPENIFRAGAKTSATNPVELIKIGDRYMISHGVGTTMREMAKGEKFVNANVIRTYRDYRHLTEMSEIDDVAQFVKHSLDTNRISKINDPARWANWPEKWRKLMGG